MLIGYARVSKADGSQSLELQRELPAAVASARSRGRESGQGAALLHEFSLARTMPTDRILTCRCDTTLVGRGRSSD